MKKTYAFALASGMLMLGSCASDAPEAPNTPATPANGEAVGYVKIVFDSPAGTRADGDETLPAYSDANATADELKIENAAFLFYDAKGGYLSTVYVDEQDLLTDHNNVNTCAVVKITNANVAQVACVLNGERSGKGEGDEAAVVGHGYNSDINVASTYDVSYYRKNNNTGAFYMSSSKYWDDNDEIKYLQPIPHGGLVSTPEEAAELVGDKAVRLYVERYVAKVKISQTVLPETATTMDPLTGEKKDQVKYTNEEGKMVTCTATFEPEYATLTAYRPKAYTLKQIGEWSDVSENPFRNNFHDAANFRSSYVAKADGDLVYPSLTNVKANSNKNKFGNTLYPFENTHGTDKEATNIVVAGKYTFKDADGNDIVTDGETFYLVGIGDSFQIYTTEADAITAMFGNPETDELVKEFTTANDNKTWTGWMKLVNKTSKAEVNAIRCMKYNGGYGYYTKAINRFTRDGQYYNAIIRNTFYQVSVDQITGMGTGIPDDNQPIIPVTPPDPSKQNYYVHIGVYVNPWQTVDTQSVKW